MSCPRPRQGLDQSWLHTPGCDASLARRPSTSQTTRSRACAGCSAARCGADTDADVVANGRGGSRERWVVAPRSLTSPSAAAHELRVLHGQDLQAAVLADQHELARYAARERAHADAVSVDLD